MNADRVSELRDHYYAMTGDVAVLANLAARDDRSPSRAFYDALRNMDHAQVLWYFEVWGEERAMDEFYREKVAA